MRKFLFFYLLFLPFFSVAQDLFELNKVKEVRVTFKEKGWDDVLDSLKKLGNDYRLPGTVYIDGIRYDSCSIRYKGNSSYNNVRNLGSSKLPFNIKSNEFKRKQRFPGGYETMKLTNIFRDPSFVREALSYEIARKYMPASKANFVRLYVNEQFLGVYNSIEPIEDVFLKNNFGNFKGDLVKCDPDWNVQEKKGCPHGDKSSLMYIGEDTGCYEPFYDAKREATLKDIVALTRILTKEPDKIETVLNVDQTLWMHALNNVMVNLDSYVGKLSHNYYLYKDSSGRFQPILWDMNLSFGGFRLDGTGNIPLTNEQMQMLSPMLHYGNAMRPLITQLLKNDLYRKIYVAHLRTILSENFTNGTYWTRANDIQKIIDTYVKSDQNKLYTYEAFQQNTTTSADAGKAKIIGIKELMEKRTTFLNAHPLLTKVPPTLTNGKHKILKDKVLVDVKIEKGTKGYVAYRPNRYTAFTTVALNDAGTNGDEKANDGIFSLSLDAKEVKQYYFIGSNEEASALLPARASKEFLEIK